MPFSAQERQQMLALKGVGPTVITRLEQLGFSSLSQLAGQEAADITWQVAQALGSSCWHNSPQARQAIANVIALAQEQQPRATAGKEAG
ncbi:Pathogenicity locus [Aquitalea sp. FJL05]|uniref:helix-hairpin-helix domain-containing protein n=1 Tax=Aquitalea sp. FJL05 TaxID=2153366 RepID=UPI000F5A0C5D|nr:helix-hairpin-helix domain-containing protein [Aquitalea sp. FJL05]RQO77552.1 Pathogenicity locus [Aquitalea sp. FJL05]